MGRIRVGLSGWSYDDWRGDFYPADLARARQLAHAASRVDTIEVNGTFHGFVSPASFRSWRGTAPRGFVYAVKGSRYITHNLKLRGAEGAVANFLASGVLELDDTLGPMLWQLPGSWHANVERLDDFLARLPKDTDAAAALARHHDDRVPDVSYGPGRTHRLRHVLEVRHASWLSDDVVRVLRRHGVALAFSHASAWPYAEEVTAGFVYVRLHGPDELYASPYGEDALRGWADRLRAWRDGGEPTDARRVTDRTPPARKERDVYVYFDNDNGGHAPRDAITLRRLLAEEDR